MEWISVEERLPLGNEEPKKEDQEFWIFSPTDGVRRTRQHSVYWNGEGLFDESVTHWKDSLKPEPPK